MGFADFDIMGKCKKILSKMDLLSENIINTLTPIVGVLGTTSDMGGTSSTGTVMAKLNTLLRINTAHGSVEFTTAGTRNWTCPEGVWQVYFIAFGGSGGGGGGGGGAYKSSGEYYATKATGGGSGAAGGVSIGMIETVPGKTYTITVGGAGAAGSAGEKKASDSSFIGGDGGNGGNGGDTKLDNVILAKGGGGGAGGKGSNEGGKEPNTINDVAGAAGGSVLNFSLSTVLYEKSNGIKGNAGTGCNKFLTSASINYYEGTSGGGAVTNSHGKSSGAGGKGGTMHRTISSITSGSKGSAGSAGYLKFIW